MRLLAVTVTGVVLLVAAGCSASSETAHSEPATPTGTSTKVGGAPLVETCAYIGTVTNNIDIGIAPASAVNQAERELDRIYNRGDAESQNVMDGLSTAMRLSSLRMGMAGNDTDAYVEASHTYHDKLSEVADACRAAGSDAVDPY